MTVAVVAMLLSTVSLFGSPAAFLAVLSLATRRRLVPLIWLGVLSFTSGLVHELLIVPHTVPEEFQAEESLGGPM